MIVKNISGSVQGYREQDGVIILRLNIGRTASVELPDYFYADLILNNIVKRESRSRRRDRL